MYQQQGSETHYSLFTIVVKTSTETPLHKYLYLKSTHIHLYLNT